MESNSFGMRKLFHAFYTYIGTHFVRRSKKVLRELDFPTCACIPDETISIIALFHIDQNKVQMKYLFTGLFIIFIYHFIVVHNNDFMRHILLLLKHSLQNLLSIYGIWNEFGMDLIRH